MPAIPSPMRTRSTTSTVWPLATPSRTAPSPPASVSPKATHGQLPLQAGPQVRRTGWPADTSYQFYGSDTENSDYDGPGLATSPDRQLGSWPMASVWKACGQRLKGITGNFLPRLTRLRQLPGRERNLVGFPLRLEPQRREGPVLRRDSFPGMIWWVHRAGAWGLRCLRLGCQQRRQVLEGGKSGQPTSTSCTQCRTAS